MKLTMLGTGNAVTTEIYNTCFTIENDGQYLLVDGGGGISLLSQFKQAGIDWHNIRDIIVTHKHTDHIMGIIWMIRLILQGMSRNKYEGTARIYSHPEVIEILTQISNMLFSEKDLINLGKRLELIEIEDGQTLNIIGKEVTFFDIHSTKAIQYGFSMKLDEKEKLTCCGDEPYNDFEEKYAVDSKWLLHEAFCLYEQADIFKPYQKCHSTTKDAAEIAQSLNVKNLILYHTEETNIMHRKELYTAEAKQYYSGNIYVPNDLEQFEL